MWSTELTVAVVISVIVALAVGVGAYLLIVKKRLEKSRAAALLKVGKEEPTLDLVALSAIEMAIYTSEVFWQDATGLIQKRVFKELDFLAQSVERFNRSLSAIPTTVDNRVPPAVAMVSSALEDSAASFRQASVTFSKAAENIATYGVSYSQHMGELRNAITQFARKQGEFDEKWALVLDERLVAEREVIEGIFQKQKELEDRLEAVFAKRLEAEQNLIRSINEKAIAIRNGRVILG